MKNIALWKFIILLNKQEKKQNNEEIQNVIVKEDSKTIFISFSPKHLPNC